MKLVIGNWKMQLTAAESVALADGLVAAWRGGQARGAAQLAVCPSHLALAAVAARLAGTELACGAQDVYWEDRGAYTGEVSAVDLRALGCVYGIVGHSERRERFGETDATAARKAAALLRHGLTPIVCVGETAEERGAGRQADVVAGQVRESLAGVAVGGHQRVLVAYEPRWAIGTGTAVEPEEAARMHAVIGDAVAGLFGAETRRHNFGIIYGGSVSPENCAALLAKSEVDGVLVGGASLDAAKFMRLAEAAERQS
jgi:triosephosphate isomerase